MSKLNSLDMIGCRGITDEGLQELRHFTTLTSLIPQ